MKITYLLIMAGLLGSGPAFGADQASAQSSPPADSQIAQAATAKPKSAMKAKAAVKAKTAAKAKARPTSKSKTKKSKKTSAKAKSAGIASVATQQDTEPAADPAAIAAATGLYKKALAEQVVKTSAAKVYAGRPQALLRSVVVLRFSVDAEGKLVQSAVLRSNHDRETEATALASLRAVQPLPRPPAILVRRGPVELYESWLFNNDGRFQIRSTALQQINR